MLLQRAGTGTIAPTGFVRPEWNTLAKAWDVAPVPETPSVTLGPTTITMGQNDDEGVDETTLYQGDHALGWDNEHPERKVAVGQFRIEWRPVTNGEFYLFYLSDARDKNVRFPASWVDIDGRMQVSISRHPYCIIVLEADRSSRYAPCTAPSRSRSRGTGRSLRPATTSPRTRR